MEKVQEITGLSRDLIIHPGETLAEVLEDREMSQRELAIRTGMSEKHISTVLRGQNNISAAFARKLEYALGIETAFWMNLQASYDRELLEFEELNHISEEEIGLLKNLKEVIDCWVSFGWLKQDSNQAALILDLRKLLGMSNLLDIPKITYSAAYRAQNRNNNVDPYVLFAWQRMCELLAQDLSKRVHISEVLDIEELRRRIPEIKGAMFLRVNQIQKELTDVFAECGIAFRIVPNFKGAPVQGFIKKSDDGAMILCMTLRQKFADIFWFTLFHEIAHILSGDTKNKFVDFDSVSGEAEARADAMARNLLIEPRAYRDFVASGAYHAAGEVERFAQSQQVQKYIVMGRLMKEERIPWGARPRYEWA